MFNAFLAVVIPLLLVFGLYHLLTWFNLFRINGRVYWKRVGLTAAVAHFLLATGFFLFTWFELRSNRTYVLLGMQYATYLFRHSAFWELITVFDTAPMLGALAAFSLMDRVGVSGPLLLVAMGMVYIVGTLQWYYVGGGVGAVFQKIWEGLKTGEEGEEWFQ
jgi:hypothetical protein